MTCNNSVNKLSTFVSRGITPKYTEETEGSIVVLNQKCIRDFKISFEQTRRSNLALHKVPDDKLLRKYDVVINSTGVGTLGRVAQYMGDLVQATVDSHVTIVRPDHEVIDPLYFGYLIKAKQTIIESLAEGSTGQTELSRDAIKELRVDFVEDREKQKKIGLMLLTLDGKIALNRQINKTLEAIAQAIFKSWFVDFEPVKAKIAAIEAGEDAEGVTRAAMRAISGKTDDELDQMQARQPEDYARLKTTAELFPSAMQDSKFGEVPEGWNPSYVGAEFDVTMGQSPPGDTYNEDRKGEPFFQGRSDFGWRYPENRVYCTQAKRMAKKGDTLLSVRAPVGDINKAVSDCCIGRGIAALRHKSGCEAYTYYSMMELSRNFKSFDSEGTVFGSINQKDLKALKIIKPSNSLVEVFTHTAGTLDQQVLNYDHQIRVLSQLRDTLLPKLLSGELSVDAIKITNEQGV